MLIPIPAGAVRLPVLADARPKSPLQIVMKGEKAAAIYIYADIGESWWGDGVTAKTIADELKALGAVDSIDVHINSYGGDVFDGLAIYRQLVEHKATITTHIDGIAASAASVIAMAGSTIKISEGGFLMIHDAWTIAVGNAKELRDTAERIDVTSGELAKLYAARSGKKSEQEVRDLMLAETWFTAQEAVDAGLADEVMQNLRAAARAVPGFVTYVRAYEGLAEDQRPFRNMPELAAPDAGDPAGIANAKSVLLQMQAKLDRRKNPRSSGRG